MKYGGGSVMLWTAISWFSVGSVLTLTGRVTARDYVAILGDHVHPMVQMLFRAMTPYSRMIMRPFTQLELLRRGLRNIGMKLNIFPGPPNTRIWHRCPPPSSLKELTGTLHEEWCNIPLATIHDLYDSIPRRIRAVLSAKGVQCHIQWRLVKFKVGVTQIKI